MNKLIKSAIILGLSVTISTPIFASTIGLNINNKEIEGTQSPVMQEGTTLVPLRVIRENLGAKVEWNAKDKKVIVIKDEDTIILTLGSKEAIVNGESKKLPQAPKTINGTTMLPVRFVAENLNCEVIYDKGSNTVFVTSDGIIAEIPDTTGWKTTVIKNPKIINGVPYLTKEQMEKAFDVTVSNEEPTVSTIERQDVHMWLYDKAWQTKGYNRINWTYVPNQPNNHIVREKSKTYYPVQYLAPYLNATIDYDKNTKELTLVYKGIKIHETIPADQKMNTIKGYVYLPDGKPARGAKVMLWEEKKNYQILDEQYILTDDNGYYEFEAIDTTQHPIIRVLSNITINGTRFVSDGISKYLTSYDNELSRSSRVEQMPDIHLVDESVWTNNNWTNNN